MAGQRVDALLVERGLAPDIKTARAFIMAGQIVAGERRVDKAGERVEPDTPLRVRRKKKHPYVGRGGLKLEGGLSAFALDPQGWVCLDLGASTGGFTDCLLQRGASRVYAVDVGYGLLDYRLQSDARVCSLERTHAAQLTTEHVPEPVDLLVADISFNSLTRILPACVGLLRPGAYVITLVKPQFEAEPSEVDEGGIVRSPAVRARARARVEAAVQALGWRCLGTVPSPITGTKGNIEYLLGAQVPD